MGLRVWTSGTWLFFSESKEENFEGQEEEEEVSMTGNLGRYGGKLLLVLRLEDFVDFVQNKSLQEPPLWYTDYFQCKAIKFLWDQDKLLSSHPPPTT